jgi:AcrR family transcriptional regulator
VRTVEKKKTLRQIQAEASRTKLQHIVQEMSESLTLDQIRIRDVCEKAGMSLGNFYQYFPSKERALLYSYKTKDDEWQSLGLESIADPLERLIRILGIHLYSMTEHSLCFDTQLYISQLKEYDSYFFSPDRFLQRATRCAIEQLQEAGLMKKSLEADEIARRILNYSRGMVFSYCIGHTESHAQWLKYASQCLCEFLTLYLTPDGIRQMARLPGGAWNGVRTPVKEEPPKP